MSRILLDPSLEVCPDFSSDTYRGIRSSITTADPNSDSAAAINQLTAAWNADLDTRKAAWAIQVQEDADHAAEAAAAIQEQEEVAKVAAEAEAEAERKEADKKKPKFPAFNPKITAPDFLQPRPSAFAKHKVATLDYVDLCYFTVEGCRDADTIRSGSAADEAFGLIQSENMLELKPMSSHKASRRVVRDEDLTWSQMSVGSTGLLKEMEVSGWPAEYRSAFASFYYALSSHPFRLRGAPGEAVLLIYAGHVRRSFHDAAKEGKPFNIAVINATLLDSIQTEYNAR